MSESSTTTCFLACTKLKFFTHIRRLLKLNISNKPFAPSLQLDAPRSVENNELKMVEKVVEKEISDEDINFMVLQRAVKRLHFGSWQEKEEAAKEITRLAKRNLKQRKMMAELGVIPPLVAMAGAHEAAERRRLAVQALVELANGTFTNKAVMVEAGILSKLPENIESLEEPTKQGFTELLLSVSSLANNGFPLTSSRIIPFAVRALDSSSSLDTTNLCLGTLHNLSLVLDNAATMVACGVISTLLRFCSSREASEKALATLGNLVVTLMGKKALEVNPMVPESLMEIMTWEEQPKCQELSAYILMILAHQSSAQRDKMAKAGIVPVLLEVALLGSPLAQKRALKLLQWFKDERQVKMGPHSGPQVGRVVIDSPVSSPRAVDEGQKLMKNIVRQSLHKNMERITSRASGAADSSRFNKSLAVSSSCKSLPY